MDTYKFNHKVYVKEGNYGWTASYIDNDVFIEVRPEFKADMPTVEGYYDVTSSSGFRKYTGPTGKVSVYSNGETEFTKSSLNDESLSTKE